MKKIAFVCFFLFIVGFIGLIANSMLQDRKIQQNHAWFLIDTDGKLVIDKPFQELGDAHEGFVSFVENNLAGLLDINGKVILNNVYLEVGDMSEGLIAVEDPNSYKWGYLDKDGNTKIPFDFTSAGPFVDGLAVVTTDKCWANDVGKTIGNTYYCGYAIIDKNANFIFQDFEETDDDYLVENIHNFSEGLAAIQYSKSKKYGYIDKSGKVVIPAQYFLAEDFHNGLARVTFSESGNYGYIDQSGKTVIEANYPFAGDFIDDLAFVGGDEFNYIDTKENTILENNVQDAKSFSDGMAAVKINDLWGYINESGDLVIPARYKEVLDFHEGVAAVYWNLDSYQTATK